MSKVGVHPLIGELQGRHREELSLGEMIGRIVAAEGRGGLIAAGLGLIALKRRHAQALPGELGEEERTWEDLVGRHFRFSVERAEELMGALLHRGGVMRCTGCGTEQKCLCGCGVAYWPERAEKPRDEIVTKSPAGRKAIGDRAMTGAERMRRSRERRKAQAAAAPIEIPRARLPKALAQTHYGQEVEANDFIRPLLEFTVSYCNSLENYHRRNFSPEDCEVLMETLHERANELHKVAQTFLDDLQRRKGGSDGQ
jgi:hypothetical protein